MLDSRLREFSTDEGFDPAEDYVGPFYYRREQDHFICAFLPEKKNCNTYGGVHGGILMTFADFSLCMAATNHYNKENCVTVSFNADFLAGAHVGDLIICRPEVTRKTKSLVFVSGKLETDSEVVMTFSSVAKRYDAE